MNRSRAVPVIEQLRRRTTCSAALRWSRFMMERAGLNALLAKRGADAIAPSAYDLWMLYRAVRKYRPNTILELGVGCSTIVMAEALSRNGSGHLYTVDGNQHWLDVTARDIPERLRQFATLSYSPVTTTEYGGDACHKFENLPDVRPDLIYLDGPHPSDIANWPLNQSELAIDPILIEDKFNAGFRMIVDARAANVALFKRHMKRKYRIRGNSIFKVTEFSLV